MMVAFAVLGGMIAFSPQASAQEQSTTTVQASPSTATIGQQVVLDSTVTCNGFTPGGLGVTFFDGPNLLATVPLDNNGNASLTTSFSTAGSHTITAAYSGDDNCGASSNTTTVQVTATPSLPTACVLCASLINITTGPINNGGQQNIGGEQNVGTHGHH